jgi:2-oxo-4-hydroxy-4-carboxy-5-ureidoimidazoline decarboxylase
MSDVLSRWNSIPEREAIEEILSCCGSLAWAKRLAGRRPIKDESSLIAASDEIWNHLESQDWMEAFSKHPRIGERTMPSAASSQSASWSVQEQRSAAHADEAAKLALAEANRDYEQRFGRVFIVCATGKSADEMLAILRRRMSNDEVTEFREAAEEQRKIANLRLKKWLSQ